MGLLTRSASAPVTAEMVHEARQRHYEEEQQAQREREKARSAKEFAERQQEELEQQRKRKATQDEYVKRRDELRAELANAEAARAKLSVAVDLSSPESAFEALRDLSLLSSADALVERATLACERHKPRL
jgi:hypothetical protein